MGRHKRKWGGRPPTEGYQRNVEHCEISTYVKPVTVKSLDPIPNADRIVKATFREVAYEAIVAKDDYTVGQSVMWIPGESVLPFELSELLGVTKHLSKGRVKTVRMKKTRSEGLASPISIASPYIDKIMKWETPITQHPSHMRKFGIKINSRQLGKDEVPEVFSRFYKMPNLLNEPFTFVRGEEVWISEKVHGCNWRSALLERPSMGWFWDKAYEFMYWLTGREKYAKIQQYVGTHNTVVRDMKGGFNELFWTAFRKDIFPGGIPEDIILFGELYGKNLNGTPIQKGYDYGEEGPRVRLFAALTVKTGQYLTPDQFKVMCKVFDKPMIESRAIIYDDIEQMRTIADSPSTLTSKHGREGCVIVANNDGRRMAKVVSFKYLSGKKRTEFH